MTVSRLFFRLGRSDMCFIHSMAAGPSLGQRLGINEQGDVDECHQNRQGQVLRFAGHVLKNSILTAGYIGVLHDLDRLNRVGLEPDVDLLRLK